jgi:glycosyltransferase involved in cell wall biosynthesis
MASLNPKVSIVVPAYNAEGTLKRCLDSLFDQELDSYEVILVNDGSTDGTLEIAREFEIKDNFVLINQPNSGVAKARWTGVAASKGRYLGFVDADDKVKSNMFSRVFNRATETDADIIVCNWENFGADNKKNTLYNNATSDDAVKNTCKIIFQKRDGHLCNKVFLRGLLTEEIFQKAYGIRFCEDLLLHIYLIPKARRIAFLADLLYERFIHSASSTRVPTMESLSDFLFVHDEMFLHFMHHEETLFRKRSPGLYMRGLLELSLICQRQPLPTEELAQLRSEIEKRKSAITLAELLRSGPGFKTILMFFLDKVGLLGLAFKIWSSPFIRSIRNFRWSSPG